ncbi:AAA domain-containing protein [Pseudomonas sp. NCHU5208]|uniref:AAA domain-containing protein n=1 Tax=unclassified Pseudomonas TaxID=196821 RepID=UPI003F968DB1
MTGQVAERTLGDLLSEQEDVQPSIDDVLHMILPLMRETARLHDSGFVAHLDAGSVLCNAQGLLCLRNPVGLEPSYATERLQQVQPSHGSALNIVGDLRLTRDSEFGVSVEDLRIMESEHGDIDKPVFVPRFRSWELLIGHHDQVTDIFLMGQILACLACGLDFRHAQDLRDFVQHRTNLFMLVDQLNPVLASIIVEMTELNRHQRASDLGSIIRRLESWRDQPLGRDVESVLNGVKEPSSRRLLVLEHLRDRLFDLSRRNRLLYFRPTLANVNLTIASVPMVMNIQSIRADQLCTWGGSFASQALSGKAVSLHKWLRFQEQPFLSSHLDKLIQDMRRDRAEYGFSNLRLVVAFMHWHNLKDNADERILSPLLWLPVELVRKKGVKDQYVLKCEESIAEFNPVLRHQLRQLYDIQLPETIDLQKVSIADLHADISQQIHQSEPNVELRLQSKPAIKLIHQKAVQRLQQFHRKRGRAFSSSIMLRPDFSYDRNDYRPLGLALFCQWVEPVKSPLRDAIGVRPVGPDAPQHAVANGQSADSATYSLSESEGHRYAWDIDLTQVTLANFNYKKMSLVRDYAQLLDEAAANDGFDRMFSIEPREVEVDAPPPIALDQQWNVVAADATQNAAVSLARTGRSFIIQGPPGTGKSQTITNLIADYAGRGQRVLFVCEKRAALDVVFHRLQQNGLDDLCCLIHDSQTDKKAFIGNLRDCYEGWLSTPHNREVLEARRNTALERMRESLSKIECFDRAMSDSTSQIGSSVRQLIQRLIMLPQVPVEVGAAARERLPNWAVWDANRELTERLNARLWESFGLVNFASHPFSQLCAQALQGEEVYGRLSAFLDKSTPLLDTLESYMDEPGSLFMADTSLANGQAVAQALARLVDANLIANLDLLDEHSRARQTLHERWSAVQALMAEQQQVQEHALHWRERLSEEDTRAALALEEQVGDSLLRFFKPAWWRLRRELHRRYDFSQHAIAPSYRSLLEKLVVVHSAEAATAKAERVLATSYGVTSSDQLMTALSQVTQAMEMSTLLRDWLKSLAASSADRARQAQRALSAARAFASLEEQLREVVAGTQLTLGELGEFLRDLREDLEALPDWIPLLRELHGADPTYVTALQTHAMGRDELEALIAAESLARVYRLDPALARFDERELTEAVNLISVAERDLLRLNAQIIKATQQQNFLEQVKRSTLVNSQLDEADKSFKRSYAKGRRELEHEFGKSMRYRAIRELASGDTGGVINDLKPIWLMSPLSVSDTLPLQSSLFDVVIFDEASQITNEEAVPALSRARQAVVVGDEMQLPPSNFFSVSGDDDEDQLMVEENGELVAIPLDADSLLTQAARNLPATLLAWHYRSRHEALISFSNAAFYEGRLITIPDRRINQRIAPSGDLQVADPNMPSLACDALLDKPISFLKVADGVYENRRNQAEAEVIAATVCELLKRDTGMSIGIVAFSEAQQGEIENALDVLAAKDQKFATLLEREYLREDDGQFNGLFVKNLENVQGDERDIILLSICYGPGPNGRMLMNFGPINQRGGEKRLNVIFSRARHRMGVVTSIHAQAITNTHNDGAVAFKTFLQFAEASSRGETEHAQSILGTLNPGAQRSFDTRMPANPLREALAKALRERGHQVHEHVGSSQFRCDLAIVDESGESYALGILLDSSRAQGHADVRGRYIFQPTVLRSFGWKVIDIPGKQWLSDQAGVIARIEYVLRDNSAISTESVTTPCIEDDVQCLTALPHDPGAPMELKMREFRFTQGNSAKFWKVAVQGDELTICFGRLGNKGQTLIKTFDSIEKAERERAKLIEEKIRKGYVEWAPE